MKLSSYQLMDSGHFHKLEQVGPYILHRPAPQACWKPSLPDKIWQKYDARFLRHKDGSGRWEKKNKRLPEEWIIQWRETPLMIRLTDFGHLGIFPEHHETFSIPPQQKKPLKLLNLFAYTGAVSIQAAQIGYQVVHCDASKASVEWAKNNAQLTGENLPIRWITDDVRKFVGREKKRQMQYDAIILDPPSFGRGLKGEVWKIEEDLLPLLDDLQSLKSPQFHLLKLSAHSPGYTPLALENIVKGYWPAESNQLSVYEMSIPEASGKRSLPSGSCCLWHKMI